MKNGILLASLSFLTLGTYAQQRIKGLIDAPMPLNLNHAALRSEMSRTYGNRHSKAANKTTATAPRWYSYVEHSDIYEAAMSGSIDYSLPFLWGSNNALIGYGDGAGGISYDTARMVSVSTIIDPTFSTSLSSGFNSYEFYSGLMKITPSDTYSIDSIVFTGVYMVNPSTLSPTGPVDTLRVSVVHGNGGSGADIYEETAVVAASSPLSNYVTPGMPMAIQRMGYDGVLHKAMGSTLVSRDIYLDNSATPPSWAADTLGSLYVGKVKFTPPIVIGAGEMIGVTVSFISGDPTFVPYDTVFLGSSGMPTKYNVFRPVVAYRGVESTVLFPRYDAADRNTGGFASSNVSTLYQPLWERYEGVYTAPSSLQHPDIRIRATCAGCAEVGEGVILNTADDVHTDKVIAYPNPVSADINIVIELQTAANVSVTLCNMLGQVVAGRNMGNVISGKAVFNSSSLPDGLYTYVVISDGRRTTGRVAIAHR